MNILSQIEVLQFKIESAEKKLIKNSSTDISEPQTAPLAKGYHNVNKPYATAKSGYVNNGFVKIVVESQP